MKNDFNYSSKHGAIDCSNEVQMVREGLRLPALNMDYAWKEKGGFLTDQQHANCKAEGLSFGVSATEAEVIKVYRHVKYPNFGKTVHAKFN